MLKSKTKRNDPCPCGSGKKFKHCHGVKDGNSSVPSLHGSFSPIQNAEKLFNAGYLKEASIQCNEILQSQPRNADALCLLGLIENMSGRSGHAETLLRKAIQSNPQHVIALNILGSTLCAMSKYDDAILAYSKAINLRPDFSNAYVNLGVALNRVGDFASAEKNLRKAIELDPRFPPAYYCLGNVFLCLGELAEAGVAYREALALQPNYPEAKNNLNITLELQGLNDEPSLDIRLGKILRDKNLLEQAIVRFRKALTTKSDNMEALYLLAQTLQMNGSYSEAIESYQKFLEIEPDNESVRYHLKALAKENIAAMPANLVAALFDSYADYFDEHLKELQYRAPEILRQKFDDVVGKKGLDIIDIGCGTGLCGLQFRPVAATLIGVDLSPRMVEKANSRNVYDKLMVSNMVSELQRKDSSYDVVVAAEVLNYLGDLDEIFAAVHFALRGKGWFLFTTEAMTDDTFKIKESGRFAHSLEYISDIASKFGFQLRLHEQIDLRLDRQQPVLGSLYILQRGE